MGLKTIFKIGYNTAMILCVCRCVSDRAVVEAIREGACSVGEIGRRCDGAGEDCGKCREAITDLLLARTTPSAA